MTGTWTANEPARPLLVLVARTAVGLPRAAWCASLGVRVVAVVTSGAGADDVPYAVWPVSPATGPKRSVTRLRSLAGRVRSTALAVRHGGASGPLWQVKRDRDVRELLRSADAVASIDRDSDAVLAAVPDLLRTDAVVLSQGWAAVNTALGILAAVLEHATVDDGPVTPRSSDVQHQAALYEQLWLAGDLRTALPQELRLAGRVAEAARAMRTSRGFLAAERLTQVLDQLPMSDQDRSASGLAARRLAADLSMGDKRPSPAVTTEVERVAAVTLDRADDRLEAGDQQGALDLLGDSMALLFNRALHAEVAESPLVADTNRYLRPLWSSRVLRRLVTRPGARPSAEDRARFAARREPGAALRVLVVPGTYGSDFHEPVLAALHGRATVTVTDLGRSFPMLRDRLLDAEILPALAAMTGAQDGSDLVGRPSTWDHKGSASDQVTYRAVRDAVAAHDVVVCDWADRTTVWVTHACPPRVRVVVRLHGLDVLDPWLHLIRWDRVTDLVVSPALRPLVEDLLGGLEADDVPVRVTPVLERLDRMVRDKHPGAERTLGLVGWGRAVKDPAWALDMLERLPGFRLLLIGAPFPDEVYPPARQYVQDLRERIGALGDRVEVVGRTDDVAGALQRVGFVVSSSLREGFHLGLAEGAASGAVPVVRDWPLLAGRGGARAVYPDSWVVEDLDAAVARILAHRERAAWEGERIEAQRLALSLFDADRAEDELRDIVLMEG